MATVTPSRPPVVNLPNLLTTSRLGLGLVLFALIQYEQWIACIVIFALAAVVLSHSVDVAQSARDEAAREDAAKVLDGLQGDILFRTGSAEISADMARSVEVLAQAVAKSPALKVRVDGYADPRGTTEYRPLRCRFAR